MAYLPFSAEAEPRAVLRDMLSVSTHLQLLQLALYVNKLFKVYSQSLQKSIKMYLSKVIIEIELIKPTQLY